MRTKKDIAKYNFYFETHDFGFLLPGLDDLLRLKEIYPNFKITCFTIPLPSEFYMDDNARHFSLEKYKKWAEVINNYDWIEIGIHGFSHTHHEMDINYDKAIELLTAAENLFDRIGLKYKKMFVAPFWQYSYDALHALKDKGYVVGLNRNNPIPRPEGLETFFYTWSIDEPSISSGPDVIAHSHTTSRGVKNGLGQCYNNLINLLPKEAKFGFLSELNKK